MCVCVCVCACVAPQNNIHAWEENFPRSYRINFCSTKFILESRFTGIVK